MKKARIKFSAITDLKDSDYVTTIQEIIDGVAAHNPPFVTPSPTLLALQTAQDLMVEKFLAARSGAHDAINSRNMQRTVTTSLIFQLADYVAQVAGTAATYEEQKSIIELANFTCSKESAPIGQLPQPVAKAEWTGNEGEVLVSWKKIYGGYSALVQRTNVDPASENAVWVDAGVSSKSKLLVTGLPFSKVWFRVIVYGKTTSIPSNPVMCVVG